MGVFPQMGEIQPFCDFYPVLSCPFFFQRPARTARPIFTLHSTNDVVQPKDGPFGVRMMSGIILGKCAPKTHTKGHEYGLSSQIAKIWKLQYLRNHISHQSNIWWRKSHRQLHVVGGPSLRYMKCNMADVRHLENWHNVIARPPVVVNYTFRENSRNTSTHLVTFRENLLVSFTFRPQKT